MLELRLLDPDGYTVPLGVATVPVEQAESTEQHLLDDVATEHAAAWAAFGYRARDYRVQTTPLASRLASPSTRSNTMSSIITIAELAAELETTVGDVSRRVSALCRELGSRNVVHTVVSANARCVLHGEAADRIRAQIAEAA